MANMTIYEAIDQVDRLKPNTLSIEDKVLWLSRLDLRIQREIYDTHEDAPLERLEEAYDPANTSAELLVPAPWDELYIHWLECQIDYANLEYDSFNNTKAMFDSVYNAFRNAWNEDHMPLAARFRYF